MRLRNSSGTSLIEILVVIVVFLVGILALVQVFPPGLAALKGASEKTTASSVAAAERERLASSRGSLPDYIAVVTHSLGINGLTVTMKGSQATREMMPPKDPGALPGRIDQNGLVILGGFPLADWQLVSGANRISRVIGESHEVSAPIAVGAQFGSLLHLNFGPMYYFLLPTGLGEFGVLQLYGNEMARREGDRKSVNQIPASFGVPRDWEFFFVDRAKTDPVGPFPGQDQLWIGPVTDKDVRVALTFSYNGPGGTEQYSSIHNIPFRLAGPALAYATIVDNYWVVSLPLLVGQPDIHNRTLYSSASVTGVYRDSVQVQRLYNELPVLTPFSANPYEYKVINGNFGSVLVNPAAFDTKVRNSRGQQVPLLASADYTVLDWRIMRDEFRAPLNQALDVKLVMSSIKPMGASGADNRVYGGIGFAGPALSASGALENRSDDFVLLDLQTGGVVLGNMPDATAALNGYHVDKARGYIQVRDTDPGTPGLQVGVAYATGDISAPWNVVVEDVAGHALRALYMVKGEWSVQVYKAASRYRVTDVVAANGLQIAECYVGASRNDLGGAPIGLATRLYFPLSDLGQRVVAGEVWYRDGFGQLQLLRDQDLLLSGVENLDGVDHAYADLSLVIGGGTFDFAMGYAVKRLRGASLTVRVLNNPSSFILTTDEVENYSRLEAWSRTWRRHETESFILGGNN